MRTEAPGRVYVNAYKGLYRARFVRPSSHWGLNVAPKGSEGHLTVSSAWSIQIFSKRWNPPLKASSPREDTFGCVSTWLKLFWVFFSTKSLCFSPRCRPFLWQFGGHDWLSSLASNEVLLALCYPHCLYGELSMSPKSMCFEYKKVDRTHDTMLLQIKSQMFCFLFGTSLW